jgi:hypothetical protein
MCFGSFLSVIMWPVFIVLFRSKYYHRTFYEEAYSYFRRPRTFPSRFTFDENTSFLSTAQMCLAPWNILYSIDFLCLSATKLMVFDRMREFALPLNKPALRVRHAVSSIVILFCLTGVSSSIAAATYRTRASLMAARASTALSEAVNPKRVSEKIREALLLVNATNLIINDADRIDSAQEFSEAIVLLVFVVSFLFVGILCARRVGIVLRSRLISDTFSASAKRLHKQIVFTAAVVFLTFLPRATFSTMKAIGGLLQNLASGLCWTSPCSVVAFRKVSAIRIQDCIEPYNQYAHMALFLEYTPEFQQLVSLISSSLAQGVALWGMTSERMLEAMRNAQRGGEKDTPLSEVTLTPFARARAK